MLGLRAVRGVTRITQTFECIILYDAEYGNIPGIDSGVLCVFTVWVLELAELAVEIAEAMMWPSSQPST